MEPCEYSCWQQLSPLFCWPWIAHGVGELEDFFSSWVVCAGEAHSRAVQAGRGCSLDTAGMVGALVWRDSPCALLEAALLFHRADEANMVHLEFHSSRNWMLCEVVGGCWGLCSHLLGPISWLVALMPKQPQAGGTLSCMLLGPPAGSRETPWLGKDGCQFFAYIILHTTYCLGRWRCLQTLTGGRPRSETLVCSGECLPYLPQEGL